MQENKENIEIKENATVVSVVVKKTSPPGFATWILSTVLAYFILNQWDFVPVVGVAIVLAIGAYQGNFGFDLATATLVVTCLSWFLAPVWVIGLLIIAVFTFKYILNSQTILVILTLLLAAILVLNVVLGYGLYQMNSSAIDLIVDTKYPELVETVNEFIINPPEDLVENIKAFSDHIQYYLTKIDSCTLQYASLKDNPPFYTMEIDDEFLKCMGFASIKETLSYGINIYQSYCNWKGKRIDTHRFQINGKTDV